jgi:hypothetical protein
MSYPCPNQASTNWWVFKLAVSGLVESRRICKCSGEFVLLPKTIEVINLKAYSLEPDDPGLAVQLQVKADIHRALLLLGSPIAPGATQNASVLLFRAWLPSLVAGVTPAH